MWIRLESSLVCFLILPCEIVGVGFSSLLNRLSCKLPPGSTPFPRTVALRVAPPGAADRVPAAAGDYASARYS